MSIELQGFEEFERTMREEIENYPDIKRKLLSRIGTIYQSEVKEQITDTGAVDTGNLRAKIGKEVLDMDTVMVGTNVEYAEYVNDGHNQKRRFVPGRWRANGTFEYIKGYRGGGMMLTERYVGGKHFFEKALTSSKPKISKEISKFMEDLKRRVEGE